MTGVTYFGPVVTTEIQNERDTLGLFTLATKPEGPKKCFPRFHHSRAQTSFAGLHLPQYASRDTYIIYIERYWTNGDVVGVKTRLEQRLAS